MKTTFFLLGLMLSFNFVFGQNWNWAKQMGSKGEDGAYAVTVDNQNNLIVAGSFKESLVTDNFSLKSKGDYDIFFAKYSADGKLIWVKQAGGDADDEAYGVSNDKDGNIYLCGYFSGTVWFENTQLISTGNRDFFIAKYDSNGNLVWVRNGEGKDEEYAVAIKTDPEGNSYVTGVFSGPCQIGDININSEGEKDIFVCKYNNKGDVLWVRQGGSKTIDEPTAISIDKNNNCYVTGWFSGIVKFGKEVMTSYGKDDIFVAKYSPDGELIKVMQGGSAESNDHSYGIAVDDKDNCYVTGSFSGIAKFSDKEIKSKGSDDIFVVKYDKEGNVLWVKQTGGIDGEYGRSVSVDSKGNVIVSGEFNTTFTVGENNLKSKGDWDIFVVKYSPNGDIISGTQAGGNGYDRPHGMAIDKSDNCYIVGRFNNMASFGKNQLQSNGQSDIFITKLSWSNK